MRRAAVTGLVLGAVAASPGCTGDAPPEPPLEMPPREALDELVARAPSARVQHSLTIDTKSCTFARYVTQFGTYPETFVLLHPLRSRCEVWLGTLFFQADLEYCLFPREDLVPIDEDPRKPLFRIGDPGHCVDDGGLPPAENANAQAATRAFTKIETN